MSEPNGDAEAGMRIDADLVRQLAALLTENDLTEIEVAHGDRRIAVKRQITTVAALAAPAAAAPAGGTAAPAIRADDTGAGAHPGTIKSPMVGTVYLSGEPGAAPFVAPGTRVETGDTLLIVEAMKVMNPIIAPRPGTVTQMLVQDAQPIEYDQPLLIIE